MSTRIESSPFIVAMLCEVLFSVVSKSHTCTKVLKCLKCSAHFSKTDTKSSILLRGLMLVCSTCASHSGTQTCTSVQCQRKYILKIYRCTCALIMIVWSKLKLRSY